MWPKMEAYEDGKADATPRASLQQSTAPEWSFSMSSSLRSLHSRRLGVELATESYAHGRVISMQQRPCRRCRPNSGASTPLQLQVSVCSKNIEHTIFFSQGRLLCLWWPRKARYNPNPILCLQLDIDENFVSQNISHTRSEVTAAARGHGSIS